MEQIDTSVENVTEQAKVIEPQEIKLIIPKCCIEGWPTCPHVAKKEPPHKVNVGL